MSELSHQPDPRLQGMRRFLWIVLVVALFLAVWGIVSRVRARAALAHATAAAAVPVVTTVRPTQSPATDDEQFVEMNQNQQMTAADDEAAKDANADNDNSDNYDHGLPTVAGRRIWPASNRCTYARMARMAWA